MGAVLEVTRPVRRHGPVNPGKSAGGRHSTLNGGDEEKQPVDGTVCCVWMLHGSLEALLSDVTSPYINKLINTNDAYYCDGSCFAERNHQNTNSDDAIDRALSPLLIV